MESGAGEHIITDFAKLLQEGGCLFFVFAFSLAALFCGRLSGLLIDRGHQKNVVFVFGFSFQPTPKKGTLKEELRIRDMVKFASCAG